MLGCLLVSAGCATSASLVGPKPVVRTLTGAITSNGSDSGTTADGRRIFQYVVSVAPVASRNEPLDFVVADTTRVSIDRVSVHAVGAADKMAAIRKVLIGSGVSVVVSYETSVGPSLGRPGVRTFRLADSLAIKTGH